MAVKILNIQINKPENVNVIIGQSHFIKTVEDLYEACIESAPNIEFGIAFSEASGKCLVRHEGNAEDLKQLAINNLLNLGAGHVFIILLRNAFPINILPRLKNVSELCNIFCATANPLEVIVVETPAGRGVIGVVDGSIPKGVEGEKEVLERKNFLRNIKYKL